MKLNATLPAGTYYIGDPCYAFDKNWSKVLNETDFFRNDEQRIKGKPVFGGGTAHGDGEYYDQDKTAYPVDAGLIAAIPVELFKIDRKLTLKKVSAENYGRIMTFDAPFECSVENGIFEFGHIRIDTDGSDQEDEF